MDRNLKLAEGVNTTFYSFLDVKAGATTDEISKAYRRRSLQLHPDKNPGVAGAQTRFERLGLIAKMLRTPEVRERYDHFYHNGFPTWCVHHSIYLVGRCMMLTQTAQEGHRLLLLALPAGLGARAGVRHARRLWLPLPRHGHLGPLAPVEDTGPH